jgi:hypothetical protein
MFKIRYAVYFNDNDFLNKVFIYILRSINLHIIEIFYEFEKLIFCLQVENLSISPNINLIDSQIQGEKLLNLKNHDHHLLTVLDDHFSNESKLNEISYLADFIHNKSSINR